MVQVHLKPIEFIYAVENARLSAKATAHLAECPRCRETLQDVRDAMRTIGRNKDKELLPDEAFWNEFTQGVHDAIRQPPRYRGGAPSAGAIAGSWQMLIASAVTVIMSVLFFGSIARDIPRSTLTRSGNDKPTAARPISGGAVDSAEGMYAVDWEVLDSESYLHTESRFYDQLYHDLSFLQLGPETLADTEGGLSPFY